MAKDRRRKMRGKKEESEMPLIIIALKQRPVKWMTEQLA